MTKLLLVRHGESEANKNGIFAGHFDVELTERGIKQAQKTAGYIKENYKVDCVYASDLKRAYKTGSCIADALGVEIIKDPMLREINAGDWDGMKFVDLVRNFPNEYKIWMGDIGKASCPNGEDMKMLGERIMSALGKIAEENPAKTIVIATHATPIRIAQTLITDGNLDNMRDITWVSNASVTELLYDDGKWQCGRIGADEHLSDLKSTLPTNV